jgi:Domain of unknown function (DUF4345)
MTVSPDRVLPTLPYVILALTGAGFIGFGLAFSLWPQSMAQLIDIQLATATARTDFAATYGGFELGFGIFLLSGLRRPIWLEPGLWAGAVSLAGFAVVRLMTLVISGGPVRPAIYFALGLEVAGAVLNFWGFRALRR